jgi:hypothetical protein
MTTLEKAPAPATPKTASQPALKIKTKAVSTASAKPAVQGVVKVKKTKLVRDSFTIPKDEFEALGTIKHRAQAAGLAIKKSEVLRAGLRLLSGLNDKALLTALKAVPTIKTGRPKNEDTVEAPKTIDKAKVKAKAKPVKAAPVTAQP